MCQALSRGLYHQARHVRKHKDASFVRHEEKAEEKIVWKKGVLPRKALDI
jgi:hypothetical protein